MSEVEWIEFRPDHKGEFDEIVARFADGMVHFEMMTDKSLYVGLYWDDGRYCQTWIHSKKRLGVNHEHGKDKPPRFDAWGREQASTSAPNPASPEPSPPRPSAF